MNETVRIEEVTNEKATPIKKKAGKMQAKNECNFTITDKTLVKNIKAYCELNKINYAKFATSVFKRFFENERTQLELMSKEQLIEVIMQWKSSQQ